MTENARCRTATLTAVIISIVCSKYKRIFMVNRGEQALIIILWDCIYISGYTPLTSFPNFTLRGTIYKCGLQIGTINRYSLQIWWCKRYVTHLSPPVAQSWRRPVLLHNKKWNFYNYNPTYEISSRQSNATQNFF